jgi:hypothetical protein
LALLLHPVVGAEDDRDAGGVDEGAAIEPDQDAAVLADRRLQHLLEAPGHGEVELADHLDVPAALLQVALGDFESLHHALSVDGRG